MLHLIGPIYNGELSKPLLTHYYQNPPLCITLIGVEVGPTIDFTHAHQRMVTCCGAHALSPPLLPVAF